MSKQILSAILILLLADTIKAEQIPLITDPHFERGFEVLDPTPGAIVVEGNLQWDTSAGPPVWQLAQWDSQSTIFGVAPTVLPSGARSYADVNKEIIVGGGPAATESDLVLMINGQSEYGGTFRGTNDPWPALLVSQRISNPGGNVANSPSIADMTALDFQMDAKLLFDNKNTGPGYNPDIHPSQYNIFYTVQNLNIASQGFGDFLWFGTALYDDREDVTGKHVLVDDFSQKLIYSIGIENFTSEHIADGNWMTVGGDLLPHIKAGLQEAWSQGLLLDSQDFADYRIGGMNMGWEMFGQNNASMQVRNYSVVANVPGQPQFQDDASTKGLWHMDTISNLDPLGGFQDFVDDDNTFGGPDRPSGRELLLGVPGAANHPTFLPTGGPDGSGALAFDGVDDAASAFNVWVEPINSDISIDFSVRPDSLPDLNADNFMGLVGVLPMQIYLIDDGSGMGKILALTFNSANAPTFGFSQGGLALDEWHDVHAQVVGSSLDVVVDGTTNSYNIGGTGLSDLDSQAVLGRDLNSLTRYFDGALDEVRIATISLVSPGILGDFNGDGNVDGADFLVWQQGFGSEFDATDLGNWEANFGAGAALAAAAVPEPTSALLMLLGLGWLVASQRRHNATSLCW